MVASVPALYARGLRVAQSVARQKDRVMDRDLEHRGASLSKGGEDSTAGRGEGRKWCMHACVQQCARRRALDKLQFPNVHLGASFALVKLMK